MDIQPLLGLYTCVSLAPLHRGDIYFDSLGEAAGVIAAAPFGAELAAVGCVV